MTTSPEVNEAVETTLQDAIRKMAKDGTVRTHSENCWLWHLPCAALWAADRLDGQEQEIVRLHDAIDVCIGYLDVLERAMLGQTKYTCTLCGRGPMEEHADDCELITTQARLHKAAGR